MFTTPLHDILKKNYAILIICILNLILWFIIQFPFSPSRFLYESFAGVNLYIANGEWWRLLTPIFIHSSFNHLLFNTLALFIITVLIDLRRPWFFLILYISSGIFGNLCTYWFTPLTFIHVGSSGAIFGLLGFTASLILLKILPEEKRKQLGFFILLAFAFTFISIGINEWAHIGGFLWGALFGTILMKNRRGSY